MWVSVRDVGNDPSLCLLRVAAARAARAGSSQARGSRPTPFPCLKALYRGHGPASGLPPRAGSGCLSRRWPQGPERGHRRASGLPPSAGSAYDTLRWRLGPGAQRPLNTEKFAINRVYRIFKI